MSNKYWLNRAAEAQSAMVDKTIEDIEAQLKKYYRSTMERVIASFEATYNKLLATIEDGREPTPADLYKLDQYWQMQAQLKEELQKLGDKEVALLSKQFEAEWEEVYNSFALKSDKAFSTIATGNAKQMINTSWLADGKNFSQRIWGNTERLAETLNEQLTHCVIMGKKPTELKQLLQQRFNVSYNQADTLVKTEAAHIQTQAAAQRYKDYGLKRYEFLGREKHEKELKCKCKELNGKIFTYGEMQVGVNAPPMHPKCRCAIIPVIEDNEIKIEGNEMNNKEKCPNCGKDFIPKDGYLVCDECKDKLLRDSYGIWATKKGYSKQDIVNSYVDEKAYDNMRYTSLYDKYINDQNWYLAKDEAKALEKLDEIKHEPDKDAYFFVCIDCGEVFLKNNPKSNHQNRCPDCQEIYRKKYKAQKEKERRAKKKTK